MTIRDVNLCADWKKKPKPILLHFTFIFSSLSGWCFDIFEDDITVTFLLHC